MRESRSGLGMAVASSRTNKTEGLVMPEKITHGGNRLLPVKEAAKRLCVSRRTVERLVANGSLPPPIKIGTKSLHLLSDLNKYVDDLVARRSGYTESVSAGVFDEEDEAEEDDGEE